MKPKYEEPIHFEPEKDIIPDHRIINIIVINDRKEILLLHRPPDNIYFGGYYHILSGKLHPGESFQDGLVREILEELQCDTNEFEIKRLGDREYTRWNNETWEMRPFLGITKGNLDIHLNEEHTDCIWTDLENIQNLPVTPQVGEMVEKLLEFSNE